MNSDLSNALQTLRQQGHAVITFNPDELNGMDPCDIEDSLISHANENLLPTGQEEDKA